MRRFLFTGLLALVLASSLACFVRPVGAQGVPRFMDPKFNWPHIVCVERSYWPWCLKCTEPVRLDTGKTAKDYCPGKHEILPSDFVARKWYKENCNCEK